MTTNKMVKCMDCADKVDIGTNSKKGLAIDNGWNYSTSKMAGKTNWICPACSQKYKSKRGK